MGTRLIYLILAVLCSIILFIYFRQTPPPLGKETLTLDIPATAYWVNTELYLHKGDRLHVSASGSWNIYVNTQSSLSGAEGNLKDPLPPCHRGELGGQIGLTGEHHTLICIGKEKELTADREGFLYLGAVDDGAREQSSGSLKVVLSGILKTNLSPSVAINDLTDKKIEELTQKNIKTIELVGQNVILTLPTLWNTVIPPNIMKAVINRLDGFYDSQKDLAGATPYNGQKIRIVLLEDTSEDIINLFYNPIFIRLSSTTLPEIFDQKLEGEGYAWVYAHEMGYSFEEIFPHYTGYFQEIWSKIFSAYTMEKFNYDYSLFYKNKITEEDLRNYLKNGTYIELEKKTFLGFAMMMDIRENYGWDPFKAFFRFMKKHPTPPNLDDAHRWSWIRDAFLKSSGTNLTPLFKKWHIPLAD